MNNTCTHCGADWVVTTIPGRAECRACGAEQEVDEGLDEGACDACGGLELDELWPGVLQCRACDAIFGDTDTDPERERKTDIRRSYWEEL
jgi:hypothetical protein